VAPRVGYGQNDKQRKDMAAYVKNTDPYKNPVVLHTLPNHDLRDSILSELLGFPYLDGPSLQTSVDDVYSETIKWRKISADNGRKWVVCSDEIGPASTGAKPDADDPEHNDIRQKVLWGNLMGGGGGVEWYFGYEFPDNDLNCENWRSRDLLWDQTRVALHFFKNHLPVPLDQFEPSEYLLTTENGYALSSTNTFVIFFFEGANRVLKLDPHVDYEVMWYNPREGGDLVAGNKTMVTGSETTDLGTPPNTPEKDWVAMITARD